MNEFSRLYKKMCATAEKIQMGRFQIRGDDRVECYGRESYADQDLPELMPIKGLSKEEMAKQVEEYVWVPTSFDLRDVFFGDRRVRGLDEFKAQWFEEWKEMNPDLIERVNKELSAEDRENALALIYVMKRKANKEWDWDKQCWVKMDKGT
jgi:hypothetical protein